MRIQALADYEDTGLFPYEINNLRAEYNELKTELNCEKKLRGVVEKERKRWIDRALDAGYGQEGQGYTVKLETYKRERDEWKARAEEAEKENENWNNVDCSNCALAGMLFGEETCEDICATKSKLINALINMTEDCERWNKYAGKLEHENDELKTELHCEKQTNEILNTVSEVWKEELKNRNEWQARTYHWVDKANSLERAIRRDADLPTMCNLCVYPNDITDDMRTDKCGICIDGSEWSFDFGRYSAKGGETE